MTLVLESLLGVIKNEAEKMTAKVFERDSFNDESDALRHFLWAGLIVAQRLIRDKKFSEENLLAEGLSSLKNGELVFLRKLGEPK